MKSLSAKAIAKILKRNGFTPVRQKGSHVVYFNSKTEARVILASPKKNKQIPIGTFLQIVQESGIPKEDFE